MSLELDEVDWGEEALSSAARKTPWSFIYNWHGREKFERWHCGIAKRPRPIKFTFKKQTTQIRQHIQSESIIFIAGDFQMAYEWWFICCRTQSGHSDSRVYSCKFTSFSNFPNLVSTTATHSLWECQTSRASAFFPSQQQTLPTKLVFSSQCQ